MGVTHTPPPHRRRAVERVGRWRSRMRLNPGRVKRVLWHTWLAVAPAVASGVVAWLLRGR